MANTFELNLPPQSWITDPSVPPGFGVVQGRPFWAFDPDTDEILRSQALQMPAAYSGAGTLKLDVWCVMASANSGDVRMVCAVEAVTSGDALAEMSGESFDTENTATQNVPTGGLYPSKLTITLTNKDSVAAGDKVRLKLSRDANHGSEDDAVGDLRFLLAVLREEV